MAKVRAFAIVVALSCICGREAKAGSPQVDPVKADEAFNRAKDLESRGQYAEACPFYALSFALDPHPGELFHLANCYEKEGRIASAWLMWRKGAEVAEAVGDSVRAMVARQHASELEPRVPRVTVTVAPQASNIPIDVSLDGTPLPTDDLGTPIPVDPGDHEVAAVGRVRRTWSSHFTAKADDAPKVEIPELAPTAVLPISPSATRHREPPLSLQTLAWTVGGAGLVATALGAAFGIAGFVNKNASMQNGNCVLYAGSPNCNSIGFDDITRARKDFLVADVTYSVGGGLLATGLALWLISQQGDAGTTKAQMSRLRPTVSLGWGSLAAQAEW